MLQAHNILNPGQYHSAVLTATFAVHSTCLAHKYSPHSNASVRMAVRHHLLLVLQAMPYLRQLMLYRRRLSSDRAQSSSRRPWIGSATAAAVAAASATAAAAAGTLPAGAPGSSYVHFF